MVLFIFWTYFTNCTLRIKKKNPQVLWNDCRPEVFMWPLRLFVLVNPKTLAVALEGVPFLSLPDWVGTAREREEGTLGRSRCNFICALTGHSSSYPSLAFKMKGALESSGPAVPLTPGLGRERTGASTRNIWSSRPVSRLHKIVNVRRGVVLALMSVWSRVVLIEAS